MGKLAINLRHGNPCLPMQLVAAAAVFGLAQLPLLAATQLVTLATARARQAELDAHEKLLNELDKEVKGTGIWRTQP